MFIKQNVKQLFTIITKGRVNEQAAEMLCVSLHIVVSLNRLPNYAEKTVWLLSRLLFVYSRDLYIAATTRTLRNIFLQSTANLDFYLFCVNVSLILNSFIIQHYLIKNVSLFNLCVIRMGLNNAATSRILVNPAVILI